MGLILVSEEDVIRIHDLVLNDGELAGMAKDKSLPGALSRIDFRLSYGLIRDVFDLAASYAVVISTGHLFNDANKRTGFRVMDVCLALNGISLEWNTAIIGPKIIAVAQGQVDELALAEWLRTQDKG
ncbi:type II toxin-antitoxin system death-on-curing family toxin [Amylibacter sp. SFDW26]|uniref:type II toxin-antitoxin system death-on-curing family toxin n=1 Tax=Amylibacter sp. SFDW26 TaxID=2652722 RepID=UPI0012627854|nr:type II toxin-antitoxin system death-on-curing family toxin [Amylibacter sp. SFDW26]KAB7613632.1 type II toxin-antitoxin system death-on-curing family toxin [Amylibacter sp. SFDW26]